MSNLATTKHIQNTMQIMLLQCKTIKIINFEINMLPQIKLMLQQLNNKLPQIPQSPFTILKDQHHHNTKNTGYHISLPQVTTTNYGLHSITYKGAKT